MIVFLTTADFIKPLASLTGKGFGFDLPEIRVESYEKALRQTRFPRATYVFSDLERLSFFELRLAGALCAALESAGLKVLNNPARVKLRYELLRDLARRGLNPFDVYRADDHPKPRRFPVFLRAESGHYFPFTDVLRDQGALDAALESLRRAGQSCTGLLVVECAPSDRFDGRWHKWGVFCASGEAVLDHIAVDDTWMVKWGRWEQLTPRIVELEHRCVQANSFASFVADAFRIANVDFGRADIAVAGGRPVLYEINTNPSIHDLKPDPHELRRDTVDVARKRLASALYRMDSTQTGEVEVPGDEVLDYCRKTQPGRSLTPRL